MPINKQYKITLKKFNIAHKKHSPPTLSIFTSPEQYQRKTCFPHRSKQIDSSINNQQHGQPVARGKSPKNLLQRVRKRVKINDAARTKSLSGSLEFLTYIFTSPPFFFETHEDQDQRVKYISMHPPGGKNSHACIA